MTKNQEMYIRKIFFQKSTLNFLHILKDFYCLAKNEDADFELVLNIFQTQIISQRKLLFWKLVQTFQFWNSVRLLHCGQ